MTTNEDSLTVVGATPVPAKGKKKLHPYLVQVAGEEQGFRYELSRTKYVVLGRSPEADIRIDDKKISRQHLRVKVSGDSLAIADLNSTNGTFVDERKIDTAVILDGGRFRIGDVIFRFELFDDIEKSYFSKILKDAKLAYIDPLTQVKSRRFLEEKLPGTLNPVTMVGIIMADIDDFKSINDTFGHKRGDTVISGVASTIRGQLRDRDVVIRYGGEEFLAVVHDIPLSTLGDLAERIRKTVFDRVRVEGKGVSISLGFTHITNITLFKKSIINADKGLYLSKRAGKNKSSFVETT